MNETVSNKNDFSNLTFDACSFAAAANYVSFKCHSIHFHIQNPKEASNMSLTLGPQIHILEHSHRVII